MSDYKLSIVTVVYNDVNNIIHTIESVLSKKNNDIEYIVIDGASTDGTIEKIERYKSQISCFVSEQDNGIYDAMNKGLKLASGDAVIFMNSGDIFAPSLNLEQFLLNHDLANSVIIGFSIQQYKGDFYLRPKRSNIQHLLNYPAHQAIFVPKKYYKLVNFNTELKIAADYYWIKEILKLAPSQITNDVIAIFALGGKSTSSKFKDIQLMNQEMNTTNSMIKSFIKFTLFNFLGRKYAFRIIYRNNYSRLPDAKDY